MLAHGGAQTQIEQTKTSLEKMGLHVEYLRWWDDTQAGDIFHHFGRTPISLLHLAKAKGMKVVMSPFMSGLGARPSWARFLQKTATSIVRTTLPRIISDTFAWDSYRLSDACVAMTPWEAYLIVHMFGAQASRVHVVPNGVEDIFLRSQPHKRGPWLICTSTIIELKQVLKLAQIAVQAQTPLWIIGKAYSESDDYAKRFITFAKQNSKIIRYEGPIYDRQTLANVYRQARGFVLLSKWESLSISALEASACECPLLLSDLPWARSVFKESANYCPMDKSIAATAPVLRRFYDAAPGLNCPPKPLSWEQVGGKLKSIYESITAGEEKG
ncbi:MAG: glycosyltransferase [Pedosphaera sp.]|nr:glycosyltransferase [Pedosphaera sp.]